MNFKKILGTVAVIAGVAMICISNYITTQVREGKLKISKAQSQVDKGSSLFNQTPVTKEIGKGITGSAQKKIDAGKKMVTDYEVIAQRLQVGGIVLIVVGVGLFAMGCMNNRKKR